ncbi:putative cytochrome P450 [Septoria linicola]|nr:putative cytochrome P450 [Septoria linicola]
MLSFTTFDKALLHMAIFLLATFIAIYLISNAIYNRYLHPYSKFPGPFWASITDLWYFRRVRYGLAGHNDLDLHKKYGSMVRISPSQILISDPAAIEIIYGPRNVFPKAEFYSGFDPSISLRAGNFEERDEAKHTLRRSIVAPLYTQASILQFEPCVDRLIALFYQRMETLAEAGTQIDMSTWLRKYTFDVIGEIFYGRKGGFGFIRDDIDYNNWCALMETMPPLSSAITYIAKPLRPLVFAAEMIFPATRAGAKGFFDVIAQAKSAVKQRVAERAEKKSDNKNDLLNRLLDLINDNPDPKVHWTEQDVTAEIWTMIWAGSDTTAVALTSIFYHLHKNPATLNKLRAEIEVAFSDGRLTYPLRYTDCIKLPYLHAVVREAMRMHSSLGLGLPRTVPPSGSHICGIPFPAGYGVIMNACAVNFDQDIFGSDAEIFSPERWIRDGEKKANEMERHMLQFGYGPRICIGKHGTNVAMYKLLPTILRDFGFEGLEGEEKTWEVFGGWFHHQKGVDVVVKKRRQGGQRAIVEVPGDKWRNQ